MFVLHKKKIKEILLKDINHYLYFHNYNKSLVYIIFSDIIILIFLYKYYEDLLNIKECFYCKKI